MMATHHRGLRPAQVLATRQSDSIAQLVAVLIFKGVDQLIEEVEHFSSTLSGQFRWIDEHQ